MTIKLSNVFDYALKAFLFIGTIFFVPVLAGTNPEEAAAFGYMVQELFFRYGVVTLFALSLSVPRVRALVFQSLPLFLITTVITAILFGFHVQMRSGILNIGMGLLFYKIVYESVDLTKLKTFAWWFGWLLFFNLVWCVLQWNGKDMLWVHVDEGRLLGQNAVGLLDKIVGFMRLKVHLGVLAALLTPLVVAYAPAFLLCIIPLVIFSQSSTAAFAVVVTCIVMGVYRMKNVMLAILSFALLAFGVWFICFFDMAAGIGGGFYERISVWSSVVGMTFKQCSVIGAVVGRFGALGFTTLQQSGVPILWKWVHNEFIQAFYEFGAVGMACLIAYIVAIHKKAQEFMKDKAVLVLYASFITIIILSLTHFPWHLGRFVPVMIFLLATLHAKIDTLSSEALEGYKNA
jgi:hypothetical protein